MPTFLHQILAVDNGIEADTKQTLEQARRIMAVGGKQDPLTGLRRTHQSRNTEKWPDLPEESRLVQITVPDLLGQVRKAMVAMLDIKYTREAGNARAAAPVVVDGEQILDDVPVGYLIFLENQLLSFITTVIDKIPVRDPAEEWHDQDTDPNLPRGVWASAPRLSPSTTRDRLVQVITEPQVINGHAFPGQYVPYETDVNTGTRTLVSYSGQLSVQDVQEMRERATQLLVAVRFARQQANMIEVETQHAGAVIFERILGGLVPPA